MTGIAGEGKPKRVHCAFRKTGWTRRPRQEAARIPFCVLDLAPVPEGATPGRALANTLDLARPAEEWGYKRHWLAERHDMDGIASAAPAVVIGAVAAATRTIRVGAARDRGLHRAPRPLSEARPPIAQGDHMG